MKSEKFKVYEAIKNAPLKKGLHSISYSSICKKTNVQNTMVSSLIRSLVLEGYISKLNNYNSTGGLLSNGYSILKEFHI